jgi:hypothetical protein
MKLTKIFQKTRCSKGCKQNVNCITGDYVIGKSKILFLLRNWNFVVRTTLLELRCENFIVRTTLLELRC